MFQLSARQWHNVTPWRVRARPLAHQMGIMQGPFVLTRSPCAEVDRSGLQMLFREVHGGCLGPSGGRKRSISAYFLMLGALTAHGASGPAVRTPALRARGCGE